MDGETLMPASGPIRYEANAHHCTIKAPVLLTFDVERSGLSSPYKIIENDHVIIIRNGERYDVTGKKL